MKKYLFTEDGTLTGTKYTYERMLGVLHEMYAKECNQKGVQYQLSYSTKYNATLIQHPVSGDYAVEINDTPIVGLESTTLFDLIPTVFLPKLIEESVMADAGWFDYPEYP